MGIDNPFNSLQIVPIGDGDALIPIEEARDISAFLHRLANEAGLIHLQSMQQRAIDPDKERKAQSVIDRLFYSPEREWGRLIEIARREAE